MLDACAQIDNELINISKLVDILQIDMYDKEAKKQLLWACRNAMQQTVLLLQLGDRYDIRKIIRGAKLCKTENDTVREMADVTNVCSDTL
jgi:hypothetical protein